MHCFAQNNRISNQKTCFSHNNGQLKTRRILKVMKKRLYKHGVFFTFPRNMIILKKVIKNHLRKGYFIDHVLRGTEMVHIP